LFSGQNHGNKVDELRSPPTDKSSKISDKVTFVLDVVLSFFFLNYVNTLIKGSNDGNWDGYPT